MLPFLRLNTPKYKNVPSKEQSRAFEAYMDQRVRLAESTGSCCIGQSFFKETDPDDLAQVFETALERCCDKYGRLTKYFSQNVTVTPSPDGTAKYEYSDDYESIETYEDDRVRVERKIAFEMAQVIREHLTRTGGKIGHFPYGGKRVVKRFTDAEAKEEYLVHLEPFSLYWPDANRMAIDETADLNAKPIPVKAPSLFHTPRKTAGLCFASAAVFFASLLLLWLINRVFSAANLLLLMLGINLMFASGLFAAYCLFRLVKGFLYGFDCEFEDLFREDFRVHHANIGNFHFQSYDKDRFSKEVQELHEYYQFLQLWADSIGKPLPAEPALEKLRFYRKIDPFVIKEDAPAATGSGSV